MDSENESPKPKAMTFAEKLDLILFRLKIVENATAKNGERVESVFRMVDERTYQIIKRLERIEAAVDKKK